MRLLLEPSTKALSVQVWDALLPRGFALGEWQFVLGAAVQNPTGKRPALVASDRPRRPPRTTTFV